MKLPIIGRVVFVAHIKYQSCSGRRRMAVAILQTWDFPKPCCMRMDRIQKNLMFGELKKLCNMYEYKIPSGVKLRGRVDCRNCTYDEASKLKTECEACQKSCGCNKMNPFHHAVTCRTTCHFSSAPKRCTQTTIAAWREYPSRNVHFIARRGRCSVREVRDDLPFLTRDNWYVILTFVWFSWPYQLLVCGQVNKFMNEMVTTILNRWNLYGHILGNLKRNIVLRECMYLCGCSAVTKGEGFRKGDLDLLKYPSWRLVVPAPFSPIADGENDHPYLAFKSTQAQKDPLRVRRLNRVVEDLDSGVCKFIAGPGTQRYRCQYRTGQMEFLASLYEKFDVYESSRSAEVKMMNLSYKNPKAAVDICIIVNDFMPAQGNGNMRVYAEYINPCDVVNVQMRLSALFSHRTSDEGFRYFTFTSHQEFFRKLYLITAEVQCHWWSAGDLKRSATPSLVYSPGGDEVAGWPPASMFNTSSEIMKQSLSRSPMITSRSNFVDNVKFGRALIKQQGTIGDETAALIRKNWAVYGKNHIQIGLNLRVVKPLPFRLSCFPKTSLRLSGILAHRGTRSKKRKAREGEDGAQ